MGKLPERRKGLEETIWSGSRSKPCVAHCIAGQPRDMISNKGIWKSYKHRLFEKFSDSPVVFVVFAATAFMGGLGGGDGTPAFVRSAVSDVDDKAMVPGFEY